MVGTSVSHYELLEVIGRGGMGVVYKARDSRLERFVALKFLPDELAENSQVLERFRREARAASALNHPNICTIHDIREEAGRTFIVMEYLEGSTVKELVAENGALPLDQLLSIGMQAAEALEAAHERGIVHRDIKSANIFVTRGGRVKILDFGLAKITPQSSTGKPGTSLDNTNTGGWAMGTIAYMSPEQALGKSLDGRTDLFSLGVVLYEMAVGRRPFHGDSTGTLFLAVVQEPPVAARELNPDMPVALQEIINRCLEKDRQKRFQHASEIVAELRELLPSRSGTQRVANSTEPGRQADASGVSRFKSRLPSSFLGSKRSWKPWVALTVLILVAAAVLMLVSYGSQGSKLTGRDTVVLADFTNTTGDPIFDGTLKQAARIDLEQSPFLNVLPERRVNDFLLEMNRKPGERLTQELAREVCLRSNSRALIAGSISLSGSEYILSMKALSCDSLREIASSEGVAKDRLRVLRTLGNADERLRRKLGESLPSLAKFNRPLEEATTSSLEALQEFTAANLQYQQNSMAAAIPHFLKAVELDPNFALAYSTLASVYYATGQETLGRQTFEQAFELRNRVGERERFSILGNYHRRVTGNNEAGIEICKQWVKLYPNDYLGYVYLGGNYHNLGNYEKSLEAYRQGMQVAPDRIGLYINTMLSYLNLDRLDEANAVFDSARKRGLDNDVLRIARYELAFYEDDLVGMQDQVKWAEGKPGSEDRLLEDVAFSESYFGRYRKSRAAGDKAVAAAVRDGIKERSWEHIANAGLREAQVGNDGQASKYLRQVPLKDSGDNVKIQTALALAIMGDSRAAQIADELDRSQPDAVVLQKTVLPSIRGYLAIRSGHPEEAIKLLNPALPYELSNALQTGLEPAYVRGLAYLKLKQGPEAAREFQKLIDHRTVVEMSVTGALAHLQLGRAEVLSGNKEAAKIHYQDFLALWKDADPDIPILKEAKAEYAALQKEH